MHFSHLPFILHSSFFFFSQIYRLFNTHYFHMHFSLLSFVLQPSFFLQSNLPFVQHPSFSYAFFFGTSTVHQIPIIFSCIFHFYHLFHAHLFFFHYKLLHPSFFSLIKSTICLISTVVIAHFYHL